MSNHVHLIIFAKENSISKVLGDFKKFTSKQIIESILNHPGENREEWMIKIFKEAGELNSRNKYYQFWQQDNEPKEIFTKQFALQKLEYIHNNPSARDYYYGKLCGLIPIEFLL